MLVNTKDSPMLQEIMKALSVRKQTANVLSAVEVPLSGTWWDGGSRSMYFVYNLISQRATKLPQYDPPQYGGPKETPIHVIADGTVLVRNDQRGQQKYITVYARRPANGGL